MITPVSGFDVQYSNPETGLSAFVFVSRHHSGGYGVALRDDDAGKFLSASIHGLTYEDACERAKRFVA